MLYDELVPQGEYLAHYGVPKDQWSPEARARHNRNHPQKGDIPGTVYRQVYENTRGAYDEYRNNNYNRGGNRSTFGSKVDEHRAQAAEARRRNRRGAGYQTQSKPDDGQHTESYRKTPGLTSKTPGRNAKPGKTSSRTSKPTPSSQSADQAIARNIRSGSRSKTSYNPTEDYRNQARNRQSSDAGRQQIERASDVITGNRTDRGNLRNYYHNGNFIKRNESTDAYLRELGIDPNTRRLVATPKRPENRVNSGTVTDRRSRRTVVNRSNNVLARESKAAAEAEIARKNAENRKNRSTRPGRNSKTWGTGKTRAANKPDSRRQYEQMGWQNNSSFRDAVEYDRRLNQWNRGSVRAGVPGSTDYGIRPTVADDVQRTINRNRRRRNNR